MIATHIANPVRVRAHVITGVLGLGDRTTLVLRGQIPFLASAEMTARHAPKPGDYFVTQEDGYQYINPKDVFERKYMAVLEPGLPSDWMPPQEILDAALLVGRYFAERNADDWQLGPCRARFPREPVDLAGLSFADALGQLQKGVRVSRSNWVDIEWICSAASPAGLEADKFWNVHTRAQAEANGGTAPVNAYFISVSAGEIQMGWTPTQQDMFANDWYVL